MAREALPTRRAFLHAGAVSVALGIAGCGAIGRGDPVDPSTDTGDSSVFEDVTVEGSDLVVTLDSGHDVTRLNLIDDGGESFANTAIEAGETTGRIQLLDIKPGIGGFDHYEPGRYELVAVHEGGTSSIDIDLEPELRITDVQQYRDGSNPADYGKLAVTVENVGTGPTWVYDITYRDAPNQAANVDLVPDPGVPQLREPEKEQEVIIDPGSTRTYIGSSSPLVFSNDSPVGCSGRVECHLIIGISTGEALDHKLVIELNGETVSIGLVGDYSCSDVSVIQEGTGSADGGSVPQRRGL